MTSVETIISNQFFATGLLLPRFSQDLKKQTALRLAQEQHQGQGLSGSVHSETANPPTQPVDSKGRPVVTPETLAARSHSAPGFSNQQQAAASYPHHYQRLHHHHNAAGHQPNYGAEMSGTPNSYSGMPAGGRYYDQGSKHARKKGARPPASVTVPVNSVSHAVSCFPVT